MLIFNIAIVLLLGWLHYRVGQIERSREQSPGYIKRDNIIPFPLRITR